MEPLTSRIPTALEVPNIYAFFNAFNDAVGVEITSLLALPQKSSVLTEKKEGLGKVRNRIPCTFTFMTAK